MDANEARRIIWAARPHIGAPMETTRDLAAVSRALELAEELIDELDRLVATVVDCRKLLEGIGGDTPSLLVQVQHIVAERDALRARVAELEYGQPEEQSRVILHSAALSGQPTPGPWEERIADMEGALRQLVGMRHSTEYGKESWFDDWADAWEHAEAALKDQGGEGQG